MCESFNWAILEHREKPIITLLESIKHYITKRMTSHKKLLHGYTRSICPKIQLVIEKNKKQAQGKWDLSGILCCHVIVCIWNIKKKPEDYVTACYRKSTFMDTYSNTVYSTNGLQLWPVDDLSIMAPPMMRRAIRRPKD
ncbi:hypothetical protein KIW84_022038 [Lathyrus oleraceus]|uniref:Uncharacterized protein n=1 Tax=Pisum sativum TaxID=3888 RepID=A0A9D4YDZ2_PEA|nr:hypothetical protein KIW84_022038 [Pisum sativum]